MQVVTTTSLKECDVGVMRMRNNETEREIIGWLFLTEVQFATKNGQENKCV